MTLVEESDIEYKWKMLIFTLASEVLNSILFKPSFSVLERFKNSSRSTFSVYYPSFY